METSSAECNPNREQFIMPEGEVELIALTSDMDDAEAGPMRLRFTDDFPGHSGSSSRRCRRSPAFFSAVFGMVLLVVVAVTMFQEKKPQRTVIVPGEETQEWEDTPGLVDSASKPPPASGSVDTKAAQEVAARVAEAAAASWDLSKLQCRCNCPSGTSPSTPPPRQHILQSASDARKHRAITLPGGLKAFLTSDPSSIQSAAAMDVGTGSASDPKEYPGLAHFLEHMLFLGSKKYPKESEYEEFLSQNGGFFNAYTDEEHTNFFFSVKASALSETLDRFAQFFASPLLRESSASREVNAVDAEHRKNVKDDNWRMDQIQKSECGGRPGHFGTGNKETLKSGSKEVVEALRKFHSEHYVAGNLRLALAGRESLDDLEKMARSAFEHVRRGEAPKKDLAPLPGPPKGVCSGGSVYIVRPLGDKRSLSINFPSRETRSLEAKRSAAMQMISFVLNGRHEGSLYEDLKFRGWAIAVGFGTGVKNADVSTFEITVELTEAGLSAVEDVVDLVLGHLRLIVDALRDYTRDQKARISHGRQALTARILQASRGDQVCNIWKDMDAIDELGFHFQESSPPANFVGGVARSLHTLPPRDILGSNAASLMDPDVTESILASLDSRRVLPKIWIHSKDFDGGDSLRDVLKKHTEPIYGTTYLKAAMPKALVERWSGDKAPTPPSTARLPTNSAEFVPKRLKLQPKPSNGAGDLKAAPTDKLHSTKDVHYRLVNKPDGVFRMPKIDMRCLAATSAAYQESATASEETNMFAMALTDALEVPLYRASLAGYSWDVSGTSRGLQVTVSGYSGDGLDNLAKRLAAAISDPPSLSKSRFDALLDLQKRSTVNAKHKILALVGMQYLLSQAFVDPDWSWKQRLSALDTITVDDALKRSQTIRSASSVSCLTHGDLSQARSERLTSEMAAILTKKSADGKDTKLNGIVALPKQKEVTNMRSPPLVEGDSNSLVIVTYQLDPVKCATDNDICTESMDQAASMALLGQIIKQRAFYQLRTKESLGYIIEAWTIAAPVEKAGGKSVYSLRVLVQSGVKSASYVHGRITLFMDNFLKQLESPQAKKADSGNEVSDSDIEMAKQGLVATLLKRPDGLEAEADRIWSEILWHRNEWKRPWELSKSVLKLKRQNLVDVLRQSLQPGKPGRKASLEVWRAGDGDPFKDDKSAINVSDPEALEAWKKKAGTWSSEL